MIDDIYDDFVNIVEKKRSLESSLIKNLYNQYKKILSHGLVQRLLKIKRLIDI